MIYRYALTLVCGIFVLVFAVMDMVSPDKDRSELENRPLQKMPVFTVRTLLDNSYTQKVEEYVSDQFFGRDVWIDIKSRTERALGKIENNGVVYGTDGFMFDRYDTLNRERFERNQGSLSEFVENNAGENISIAILPSSYMVLGEKLPRGLMNLDQRSYLGYFDLPGARNLSYGIWEALQEKADEYIYYRTDHHWTTQGARYAYEAFAKSEGLDYARDADLPVKISLEGFLGTFYSRSKNLGAKADVLDYYEIEVESVVIGETQADGLYDLEAFESSGKYAGFLHGNNGLTVIRSRQNRNPGSGRVLVVKDSYANCFVPFLAYSFDEIYVVDLRFASRPLSEIVAEGFESILIMYSFMNFATDANVHRLNY